MSDQKRLVWTLPNGRIGITEIVSLRDMRLPVDSFDDQDVEDSWAYAMEKAGFELFRWELPNPNLGSDALRKWQANLHFDEWQGEYGAPCREITTADLPSSREFRNRWADDGVKIYVRDEV